MTPPRAVFDCMVFVQALANDKGPAYGCYELVRGERLILCVSPDVIAEVGEVLSRPKLQKKLPALTPERIEAFLAEVATRAELTEDVPEVFSLERDPKDERYVNLALSSKAEFLVSWDKDLLDLMADEGFRSSYCGLTVLTPPALLEKLAPAPEVTPTEDRGTKE